MTDPAWWARLPGAIKSLVGAGGAIALVVVATLTLSGALRIPNDLRAADLKTNDRIDSLASAVGTLRQEMGNYLREASEKQDTLLTGVRELRRDLCIDRAERAGTSARSCAKDQ